MTIFYYKVQNHNLSTLENYDFKKLTISVVLTVLKIWNHKKMEEYTPKSWEISNAWAT